MSILNRTPRTILLAAAALTLAAPSAAFAAKTATDLDGDGLPNAAESTYGTNPNKADTDRDGLKDGREVKLRTNPLRKDTDGDGLTDGYEVKVSKTNPLKPNKLRTGAS